MGLGRQRWLTGPAFQVELDDWKLLAEQLVPEPGSLAIFGVIAGGMGFGAVRRRRKNG